MIKIDIDVRGLEARTSLESKRLAYSTATAINRTMLEIQREERAELDRRFTIRKNDFMYRLIKIVTFAKVFKGTGPQQVYGEIGIDHKNRTLLDQFVEGGFKEPVVGHTVGVPVTGSAAPIVLRSRHGCSTAVEDQPASARSEGWHHAADLRTGRRNLHAAQRQARHDAARPVPENRRHDSRDVSVSPASGPQETLRLSGHCPAGLRRGVRTGIRPGLQIAVVVRFETFRALASMSVIAMFVRRDKPA